MSAFKRLLQEGIKPDNCLASFRVLKRHLTSSASACQKERAPIIESALERKADKFHGNIRRSPDEEALSELKDAVAEFKAKFDKLDHQLAESYTATMKTACRRLIYLGIFSGVYLGAFFEALLYMKRTAKKVDGPSPPQM